jgi:ATP-dependent DNA helicase RecQ
MPTTPSMPDLLALIEKTWGFRNLLPLQQPAMQAFLDRRDSLTVLPTGGGKSLCYQAPAILLSQSGLGPTVVVSPLIALMKDQVDSLREIGVAAAQLDSSLSPDDRRATTADLRAGRLHLLFVSPERLVGEGSDSFQQLLRDANVHSFAIDEAHCISHWGHDFRPEYRQLSRLKQFFPDAAVHAFTATATQNVRQDIASQLQLHTPALLVGNFDRPNLTYRVLPRRDLFGQIRDVLDRHQDEAGIIYAMRRKDVDTISQYLAEDKSLGRNVGGYHAGMSNDLRRKIQEKFLNEELDIIVATIAFGMGIDRSNIRFVLHVAMPKSVEAYQQETGRAGRDGLEAECVLLYSASDTMLWKSIVEKSASEANRGGADGIRLDPAFLPSALKHIDDMDRFARGATCRHQTLVEYFGQKYQPPSSPIEGDELQDSGLNSQDPKLKTQDSSLKTHGCAACDMCLGDTTPVEGSLIIAQKILSCIARTNQRFGAGHVISILRGENTQRIRDLHHDELSTYGLLKEFTAPELRDFVYQLLGQGALAQENLLLSSGQAVPILKLNQTSVDLMRGKGSVRLIQIVRKSAAEARQTRAETLSWEGVDHELFEILRAWRKKLAAKRNVAPYMILSDNTLRQLARQRPTTAENLRLVYGIGQAKLKDLASHLLPLIHDHSQTHHLPTDVMTTPLESGRSSEPPLSAPAGLALTASRREAAGYFRQGQSIEQVAQKMGRAPSTVAQYLVEYIVANKPESIATWVPEAVYRQVAGVAEQRGFASPKAIFVALEEKISYDPIRLVLAHLRAKNAL